MSEINLLPAVGQDLIHKLAKSGYQSVFDIVENSRAAFVNTLPEVDHQHAGQIYSDAQQRAQMLKMMFRSWQLRQEPVISGLKKLAPAPVETLHKALARNIGGDGDFTDLMARSSQYADAASIQSLFSPGRYATALYAVAKKLHKDTSALAIDQRRPDLRALILSDASQNNEVSSLDILLEVLQGEDAILLSQLSSSYFPMILPYDDRLSQISHALSAQGRSLSGIWEKLSDIQRQSLMPPVYAGTALRRTFSQPAPAVTRNTDGKKFYLKANNTMVWLAHPLVTGSGATAHLVLEEPDAADKFIAPLMFAIISGGQAETLRLGLEGEVVFTVGTLKNAWLAGSNGEQNGVDGNVAALSNSSGVGKLMIKLTFNDDDSVSIRTSKGWIGVDTAAGQANWKSPLVLDASEDQALKFTLCADEEGEQQLIPALQLPAPPLLPPQAPNPPARTTLSLTPLSYQLLVNDDPKLDDIADHYGYGSSAEYFGDEGKIEERAENLADLLNVTTSFCRQTALTFNQLLELTAQRFYKQSGGKSGEAKAPVSRYIKFGASVPVNVNKYGATLLNAGVDATAANTFLWVQPEIRNTSGTVTTPAALNFTENTLVPLAGSAEKLIRLRNTTGLSFEMLDWVIANASRAAGYQKSVLEANVLEALAACVSLQQRYAIDANMFTTFIGAVNPYAPAQQKSAYQRLFTAADGTFTQPISGADANIAGAAQPAKYAAQRALFCKAAGVTDDELSRILSYCDLKPGDAFDEYTAARISRFGAIARMLGLTFAEAECLWTLLEGKAGLYRLGAVDGLYALALISRSEQLLVWMADNNLNLIQLQAMVSRQHSDTATAEMFTFLQNIYSSVNDEAPASRDAALADGLRQKLLRALAGGFGLKTPVTGLLTDWLAGIADFTLAAYWADISQFFNDEQNTSVDALQSYPTALVVQTHQLSQLVVISRWLDLSEQDLTLLTAVPSQLDATLTGTPQPDLALLLLLSRFKRWQSEVTVTRDEALRLLPLLAAEQTTAGQAAAKIASLHNLSENSVQSLGRLLFGEQGYPADFAQLWQLLSWAHSGQQLNVGVATLNDLLTMAHGDEQAEQRALITRVAENLAAGLTR